MQVVRSMMGTVRCCRTSGLRPAWVTTPHPATSQSVPGSTSWSSRCKGRGLTWGPNNTFWASWGGGGRARCLSRGQSQEMRAEAGRRWRTGTLLQKGGLQRPHLKEDEVVLDAVRPAARVKHCPLHIIQSLVGFGDGQGVGAQEHLHKVYPGPGDRTRAHLRSASRPPEAPLLPPHRTPPHPTPPLTLHPCSARRSAPSARPPGRHRTRVCRSLAPKPCRAARGPWPPGHPESGLGAALLRKGGGL